MNIVTYKIIATQHPQHTHGQRYSSSIFFVPAQLIHAQWRHITTVVVVTWCVFCRSMPRPLLGNRLLNTFLASASDNSGESIAKQCLGKQASSKIQTVSSVGSVPIGYNKLIQKLVAIERIGP
jgi:hypothetical protein